MLPNETRTRSSGMFLVEPSHFMLTSHQILAARELQGVSRTMKKLWLAGPLRPLGEDETNPQTSEDQKRVIEMAQKLMADYRGSTSLQQEGV